MLRFWSFKVKISRNLCLGVKKGSSELTKQERSQTLNPGWARKQHFLILLDFLSSFLNFSPFSSSIWGSRWAGRPSGKALATPLLKKAEREGGLANLKEGVKRGSSMPHISFPHFFRNPLLDRMFRFKDENGQFETYKNATYVNSEL